MNSSNDKRLSAVDDLIVGTCNSDVPPTVRQRMEAQLVALRQQLDGHERTAAPGTRVNSTRDKEASHQRPHRLWWRVLQPSMLAASVTGCVALVTMLLIGTETPTWAQVAEKFTSVKTFNLTFYRREHALSDVKQLELWMASDGRVRVKTGSQVVFARKGKVTKAFDVQKRKEVEADRMAMYLLLPLGGRETFSLDVVVRLFSGGTLKDVTPLVNSKVALGEDMVVYDIQSPRTPEWCRIWALRDSRLPVRIQAWDPRDGEYAEGLFTYGSEPAAAFFDAETFARRLADRAISSKTLGYVDLGDAVGKTFVPAAPECAKALGVVTRTLDGQRWSLKDRMGKITVLHIWNPREGGPAGIMHDRRDLISLYEKYGQREDFQIVTLGVFEDPARLRKMKDEQQVPWPILHDPKGWKGELARAIGGPQHTSIYLADRQGRITKINDPRLIEVELVGPTYENYHLIRFHFDAAVRAGQLTTERVRTIFGEPDGRGPSPRGADHERWIYIRRDDRQERERRVIVEADRTKGIVTGLLQSHRILEPAKLTVTVTPEYWTTKVLPQVRPEYRPENDHDDAYRMTLCVRIRGVDRDLGGTSLSPDFVPGTHSMELRHGTGQLVVRVRQRAKGRETQRLVIKDDILLEKNKTTEIKLK